MAYIGNPPAPQNITSSEITDGTIVNVDIASDAAIAATKIAGLSTVATTGAYSDVTGTPTIPVAGTDFVAQTGGTFTGDVSFGDSDKAIFGAGSDLQIYHDGGNSHIKEEGSGILFISGSSEIQLRTATDEVYIQCIENSGVNLRHDNSQKLATTATGVDITGNATFADNGKAIFGAGSDLQIHHNGANSYIDDTSTGNLYLRSDGAGVIVESTAGVTMARFLNGNACDFNFGSTTRLTTTSTGINVTGTAEVDTLKFSDNTTQTSAGASTGKAIAMAIVFGG